MPFRMDPIVRITLGLVVWTVLLAGFALAGHVEGFVEPYRKVDLSATGEPGVITEINVREGESVKKDELVAVVDTAVLEVSLAIAQKRASMTGRLDAAKAEVELRKDRVEKLRALRGRGHVSINELQRAETDLDVAMANYVLAEEERDLSQLECKRIQAQIEQRQLRSPFDGVVVEVFREVGEATQISEARMMTMVQLDKLRVKFPVSVDDAAKIVAGEMVEVELPEIKEKIKVEVELVSPVLDAKSGTVQISCVIDNHDGKIRSGMRCLLPVEGESRYEAELDFATSLKYGQ